MDQNFLDLLQLFAQHRVKYLIIGGYAVSHYSEPRYTKDIDFWIECSGKNARNLYKALQEFGAPLATITEKDFAIPGTAYTAGLPPLRFDILTRVSGGNFKEAYARKKIIKIGSTALFYVPFDVLINLKKSANRPQDKIDVKKLQTFSKVSEHLTQDWSKVKVKSKRTVK